mgnify:CR=1 FL=1|tara:strand:+ start:90 stop:746 length:657 start_codon:yes stop_codon:yes gene_type:complete
MSIVIKAPSGGGSVSFDTQQSVTGDHTLQLPTGVGSAGQYLRNSSTAGTLEFGDLPSSVVFTEKTAVDSTSGTAVNFTNIPANAYRITVMLDGVSTNGSNNLMLGIGDSGGVETTGYKGSAGAGTASGVYASRDPGFCLSYNNNSNASYAHSGSVILTNLTGNTWALQGATFTGAYGVGAFIGGVKTLSGTLDRVQVYTNGGVDTFDAGKINIIYEVQ